MRFVVVGAGAVGGVVGGRLFQHGHDVVLVARGEHGAAIRDRGLTVASPDVRVTLPVPVVDHPGGISWRDGDAVLLAVKSQDTADALRSLAAVAPATVPVACAQNGVSNEPAAARRFHRVYGILVRCAASFLDPGEVVAYSAPTTGILDLGRYPEGADALAEEIASAFRASTFRSEVRPDIMRWKHAKLLLNLRNAAVAVCAPGPERDELVDRARREGARVLRGAGIDAASLRELAGGAGRLTLRPVEGRRRPGGSSWQSLARGSGSIEAEHLNGEIVRLGRLHHVPTPVNELLVRLAGEAARLRRPPGDVSAAELLRLLDVGAGVRRRDGSPGGSRRRGRRSTAAE